jgi:hypothetical protein
MCRAMNHGTKIFAMILQDDRSTDASESKLTIEETAIDCSLLYNVPFASMKSTDAFGSSLADNCYFFVISW